MSFAGEEADRLAAYLDALARGQPADPAGLDPELVATIAQAAALHARAVPDPALKAALWSTLMTATSPTAPSSILAGVGPSARPMPTPSPRWRHPRQALNAFSTAGLMLLVALLSGWLLLRQPGTSSPPAALISGGRDASPTAPVACLDTPGAVFTAPKAVLFAPTAQLWALDAAAAQAEQVQLQGWSVDAGASVALPGSQDGLAVDFVLTGYYSAVFNGPAFVARSGSLSLAESPPMLVAAGEPVDLAQGDAVAFNLSAGMTLRNLSAARPLSFKRALFTTTAASAPPAVVGAAVAVNQTTVLPRPLGEQLGTADGILLLAVQYGGTDDATPQARCADPTQLRALTTREGPSAATPTTEPSTGAAPNGYALWILPNEP